MDAILAADRYLLSYFNGLSGNVWLDQFMIFLSAHWPWVSLLLGYLLWIIWSRQKSRFNQLLWIALTLGLGDFLAAYVLKPWFARVRPCKLDGLVNIVDGCAGLYSFPSNHAANAAVFSTLWLCFYGTRQGIIALFLAIWVGLSRVYLGVHYPSDILVGFCYGAILGLFSYYLSRGPFGDHFLGLKNRAT